MRSRELDAQAASDLQARVLTLETEKRALEEEYGEMSRRFIELERQNAHLASLFVACHELLASADREDVLTTILEIVTNLIGSEEVAIFECDPPTGQLVLAACRGMVDDRYQRIPIGSGAIGRVAASGRPYLAAESGEPAAASENPELTACIPLRVQERVIGVVAIFRLLPQKNGFTRVDEELFELLGAQAATALLSSMERSRHGAWTRP
jgi:GAF domain-containing protein